MPTMSWSSWSIAAVPAVLISGLACVDAPKPPTEWDGCPTIQVPLDWELGVLPAELPAEIASVFPASLRPAVDTVFFAQQVDLNCDGLPDLVAYALGAADSPLSGRLSILGYLRTPEGWRNVLAAPSRVDGREVLVLAAPLTERHHIDLVTLGMDEGGTTPRVFRWVGNQYDEVRVPVEYSLRHEEAWGPTCRRRAVPRLGPGATLILPRETISRGALVGHGADCGLPRDTLRVYQDSLVPGLTWRGRT